MSAKISINWKEDMSFNTHVNGHSIVIDADEKVGGKDRGPRPKPLLLVALGGCTAMDVVSILKKMRVEFDKFDIDVEAESTSEHPVYYKKIKINYHFTGHQLPEDKIEKAVKLSQERYCGVSEMLKKAAALEHEIFIHEA